ncbi:MAG: ATP-binding protein, partial [Candidatus Tectomicrobia bacterium]|nr:ATP-binding protein [Candidatus Tectomicrobia bacterium]
MKLADIKRITSGGESEVLEFKKSTGQLTRAAETLCAFLNAQGGTVIIGIAPDGKIVGQQVSDKTQQDIANILDQRQLRAPAFKLLEEALLFCQRHLPLPGRIEPGRLERVDRPLIPPD